MLPLFLSAYLTGNEKTTFSFSDSGVFRIYFIQPFIFLGQSNLESSSGFRNFKHVQKIVVWFNELILFLSFLRFRTAINVLGDSIGAGIVYELSKGDLEEVANKKTTDGGFEAVPMTEIEDDNK